MELPRHVIVLFHIVGFAVTFGAWGRGGRGTVQADSDHGLWAAGVAGQRVGAGCTLAGVVLNYPKIGLKLAILVALGGLLGWAVPAKSGR